MQPSRIYYLRKAKLCYPMKIAIRYIFKILCIVVSVFISTNTNAQGLTRYASSVDGIDAERVSIYIEDMRSGEVILDVNGELPMTPASVTKLFTAATIFQTSVLKNTFKTHVYINGEIKNKTLQGNLIIESSGDPTLESKYFPDHQGIIDSIIYSIKAIGINNINGSILVEMPSWLKEKTPDGWKLTDVAWPYGAGYYPFNYADNKVVMRFNKDGSYTFKPNTPGLKARKGEIREGESVWREKDSEIYNVRWRSNKPLVLEVANPLPQNTFISTLKLKLTNNNIAFSENQNIKSKKRQLIYIHESPTIYEILKSLVLRSDNQMAEAMLRHAFPNTSRSVAVKNEHDLWNTLGVDIQDMYLEDGSGLSRNNKITAYTLADMLIWMALNDKNFIDFLKMFPRAGETGTLKSFLKDTPLQGRFVAKTGSLNKVQCYAGYNLDEIGVPTHVVVIMINGFKGNRASLKTKLQDLLLEKLLSEEQL